MRIGQAGNIIQRRGDEQGDGVARGDQANAGATPVAVIPLPPKAA